MQQTAPHSSATAGRFAHPPRNVAALGIEPGMKVADFGSGSGAYVLLIAKRLEGVGHVYAVDIQRDLLRRVTTEAHGKGYENVDVIWADLERPGASKIKDETLDVVLVSNLLFQVEHKENVLAEASRIIHPGGRVVIIDWIESFGGMGPQKRDVFSKERARSLAEAAGLELYREFPAGAHHYGLIFRKPLPRRSL